MCKIEETQIFEFDWAVVIANKVFINPVGTDEWEMTVKPKDGGDGLTRRVYDANWDETLYDIAHRVYRDWMIDNI